MGYKIFTYKLLNVFRDDIFRRKMDRKLSFHSIKNTPYLDEAELVTTQSVIKKIIFLSLRSPYVEKCFRFSKCLKITKRKT